MRRTLFAILLAVGASGCGGDPKPLPMAATLESSRETLLLVLDGWKAGKTFQELNAGSPPVQFIDDDLNRGSKLADYRIEGEGQTRGTGYSYIVVLKVQDKDGKTRDKKVAYAVTTDPKRSVTREDRQP